MSRKKRKNSNRNVSMEMGEERRTRKSSLTIQLLIAAATAKLHCDEAATHLKAEHYQQALNSYNAALELNSKNKEALVARSRCYILLGKPDMALNDAETALSLHRNYIPALYQKAESLFHLGHFEHSLMYYHRGLKLRPTQQKFRLGIQKAQEAIVNTIGPTVNVGANYMELVKNKAGSSQSGKISDKLPSRASSIQRHHSKSVTPTAEVCSMASVPTPTVQNTGTNQQLLGALSVDKHYLEQLVKQPNLKCLDKGNNSILTNVQEALEYLSVRQEFWKQQAPPPSKTKTN